MYVQIRHFYYYCCCCCRRASGPGVNRVFPEHVNAASLPQQCCQTVTSPRNRTAAGVSDGRQWTFCFVRFILHFRTFPDLSTPPSRPSAGIRQRWNGCLKRTTLSVTGFRVLRNETFLPCHASSFLFWPLRFIVSVRISAESQTCVSVFAAWRKTGKIHDVAEIAALASAFIPLAVTLLMPSSAWIMTSCTIRPSIDSGMLYYTCNS